MKKVIDRVIKKRIFIPVFGLLLTAAVAAVFVVNYISSSGEEKSPFAESVEFGGKMYTKEEPLVLLDIVADTCLSDYAYMTGADRGAVKWSDICMLPTGTDAQKARKKEVSDAYVALYQNLLLVGGGSQIQAQLSNDGGRTWEIYSQMSDVASYLKEGTRIRFGTVKTWWPMEVDVEACYELGTDNLLAYKIFDNMDMCDKFEVVVRSASEVTVEDVESCDAVYVDCGVNSNTQQAAVLYQKMYQCVQGTELSSSYPSVAGITDTDLPNVYGNNFTAEKDLTAPVAGKIFFRYLNQDIAFMCDAVNGIKTPSTNIQKLYGLMVGINRDVLKEELCMNKVSDGIYSGTKGQLDLNTLTVSIYRNEDRDLLVTVPWDDMMFGVFGAWPDVFNEWTGQLSYVPAEYPYFNITCNQYMVNENLMIWGALDSTFGSGLLTNEKTIGTWDFKEGTTIDQMVEMYGKPDGSGGYTIDTVKMLLYILGGYKNNQGITGIRVLEIEPAGACRYNTYAGAQEIAAYFGVTFRNMTEENYQNYIQVTPVAMNGFIAMTEDIYNAYDLVILSDYNPKGYIQEENAGGVYTADGEMMELDDGLDGKTLYAAMSGNDLTHKALNKLMEYAQKGKPMVIADGIYNGLKSSTPESDEKWETKVYQFSQYQLYKEKVPMANIRCEQRDLENIVKLEYCPTPSVTIDDSLKCTYSGDVAVSNFKAEDISRGIEFKGKIGDTAGARYGLKVYFDKDGNGLYTEGSLDDGDSELYVDEQVMTGADGTFSLTVTLPGGMRGYVAWKAVVTEITTGYSSQDTGALVIEYSGSEIKEVRVLQIVPGSTVSDSNLRMDTGTFVNLFSDISKVVGLKLNVTVKTVAEFEQLYHNRPYTKGGDYTNAQKNQLYDYSMVVFGFADNFNKLDVSNENGALDNVMDYIEKGNSVLFSHDSMIYSAYSDGDYINEPYTKEQEAFDTSFYMTSFFRDIIGQDRYHASQMNNGLNYQQGFTNAFLMKRAKFNGSKYVMYSNMPQTVADPKYTITTEMVKKLNTGQVTQYPYQIDNELSVATTHAQWFQVDLESHNADYSESPDDVIVWYTLDQNEDRESSAAKDTKVRITKHGSWTLVSNFLRAQESARGQSGNELSSAAKPASGSYIEITPAVKGTVEITMRGNKEAKTYLVSSDGASLKTANINPNSNVTMKYQMEAGKTYYIYCGFKKSSNKDTKLYLNQIKFTPSSDSDYSLTWSAGQLDKEIITEQDASVPDSTNKSNYYGLSGQDALNNYYIYSKGNITYSGAGHSSMSGDSNSQELKLFVNTIVKAIKSGNNRPEVAVENALDQGNNSYEQFIRSDDSAVAVTFTASDIDMGVDHGAFSAGLIYWDTDQDGTFTEGTDVVLKNYNKTDILYNLEKVTFPLGEYYDYTAPGESRTLKDDLVNNRLVIGIQAVDSHDAAGQAIVKLVRRDLFRLN